MQLEADTKEVKRGKKTKYVAFLATQRGTILKETKPQASRSEALTKLKISDPNDLVDLNDEEEEL